MSRRAKLGGLALAGVVMVTVPLMAHTRAFLWNVTESAPRGLYLVLPTAVVRVGDIVAATPPADQADMLNERGYLPTGVLLLKKVVARHTAEVCRDGPIVTLNGKPVALAYVVDREQRPLPVWDGCRRLDRDQVFLLNAGVPDSLDGRYFGPTNLRSIVGRAYPIWTW